MHVLVTGGTGVVGSEAVNHLLEHGHAVRLFSRHAEEDSAQWESGVEPHTGSVGKDEDVHGAAEGCDAVLHITGIVEESPPEATFQNINVEGTRRVVEEAARAGVQRFVYVSSLGADRGSSDYHRSKLAGEQIARTFPGNWLIVRLGNVYGPGDEVLSTLLKMVRTMPAIPVIGSGDQPFQPLWAGDVGEALALAVEWEEPSREVLEVAGAVPTTMNEVLDLLEGITDKSPPRVPIPEWAAFAGTKAAELVGADLPINADQISMLLEENVIRPPSTNAITEIFGIMPVPLTEGLAKLADSLPEKSPSEGRGSLHRQRYWADIQGSRLSLDELFEMFRHEFSSIAPEGLLEVGAEPGTPLVMEEGATLTMAIPLRGTIQVRVAEIKDRAITCVTLEGHPLTGAIRFLFEEMGRNLRFEVRSYTRAATLVDLVGMRTVGKVAQEATWEAVVEEVVRRSGGEAVEGIQSLEETMEEEDARGVEEWVEERIMERHREENPKAKNSRATESQAAHAAPRLVGGA
ncbi:hypothetical protein BH23GEM7_BH23GEM7_40020 [soil metagenome]